MFFDKLGEGKITDHKKVAANIYRDSYEISLRNHKKESVLVKVREHQYGDWIILLPSPKYTKKTLIPWNLRCWWKPMSKPPSLIPPNISFKTQSLLV